MAERFIKFIPSEISDHLRSKHPFAFLLLQLVAERARRLPGDPSGLKVGEAYIGDYESIGATRGQYRHALVVLTQYKLLQIMETCRNRKKTTTGTTTVGTKVKLIDSSIWDLNLEDNNQWNNHPTTTEQPPNNHEQERNNNVKKEQQQPAAPVAVFSSLEKIKDPSVTDKEKLRISKKYDQPSVDNAVAVVTDPHFVPKETMLRSLNAALVGEWKPRLSPKPNTKQLKENIQANRMLVDGTLYENRIEANVVKINKSCSISLSLNPKEFKETFTKYTKQK